MRPLLKETSRKILDVSFFCLYMPKTGTLIAAIRVLVFGM